MEERRRSPDSAVYVISVVAELAGVHPQTLRTYERKGLMEPQRTAGNSRRYSDRDVDRLRRIQELTQEEGVNLAGVRIIMGLEKELEYAHDQLDTVAKRLASAERELGERRRRGMLVRLSDVRNIFEPKGKN